MSSANLPFVFVSHQPQNDLITLSGGEAKHLIKSLRAKPADNFIAFDGNGNGWVAEVINISKSTVTAKSLETIAQKRENVTELQIAVGMVKSTRMDWAIEKASEAGADVFIPLKTEFSVVQAGRSRVERWRGLALAAAKQSRRFSIMTVQEPVRLNEFLSNRSADGNMMVMHNAPDCLPIIEEAAKVDYSNDTTLFIGPEGGFSPVEIDNFKRYGASLITLGNHPLRTETATAVSLSIIQSVRSHGR